MHKIMLLKPIPHNCTYLMHYYLQVRTNQEQSRTMLQLNGDIG